MHKHESFRLKVLLKRKLLSEFIVKGCEKFHRMLFASRFYGIHGYEILAHFHDKNVCEFLCSFSHILGEYFCMFMKFSEEFQIFSWRHISMNSSMKRRKVRWSSLRFQGWDSLKSVERCYQWEEFKVILGVIQNRRLSEIGAKYPPAPFVYSFLYSFLYSICMVCLFQTHPPQKPIDVNSEWPS